MPPEGPNGGDRYGDGPGVGRLRPLRITEIRRESSTITSFRLAPPDDVPIAEAAACQYLTVRLRRDSRRAATDPQLLTLGARR